MSWRGFPLASAGFRMGPQWLMNLLTGRLFSWQACYSVPPPPFSKWGASLHFGKFSSVWPSLYLSTRAGSPEGTGEAILKWWECGSIPSILRKGLDVTEAIAIKQIVDCGVKWKLISIGSDLTILKWLNEVVALFTMIRRQILLLLWFVRAVIVLFFLHVQVLQVAVYIILHFTFLRQQYHCSTLLKIFYHGPEIKIILAYNIFKLHLDYLRDKATQLLLSLLFLLLIHIYDVL